MTCPYCNKEMKKGVIYGDRYALKWIDQEHDHGVLATPIMNIGKGLILEKDRSGVVSHYCLECRKIIIDMNDNE